MKRLLLYPALIFIYFLLLDQNALAQGSTVIFSATGDVPYGSNEYPILEQQIVDHNLYSPSKFLIHVGDIKEGTSSCPESIYEDVSAMLKELAVPVYIVPGDNEYNDCSNPTQAWQYWTNYFMHFEENFCGAFATEHQSVRQENFAFVLDGVLFIGINLVGGRVHSQSEWNTRMQQDADWVEFQFQDKISQVRAAVVFAQAGPGNSNRDLFFDQFEQSAADFAKPILFLHGDGHSWKNDKPFPQQNVTRVQVNMGGNEDPVQVTVNMNSSNPWVFKRNPWSSNPPLYNVAPCVEAGADTTVTMPASASLHARASDDGVPLNPGNITLAWSKTSGPGTVTFGNPSSATTTASFSAAGTYVLRLTANDGALQNYDELTVTVQGLGAYLSINDVEVTEGNSGSANAVFTVTRVGGSGISFTVNYATADSTATQGIDYTAVSGTLSFSGSTTTRTITVPVLGETLIEPDEYFLVNLSNPSNATISDGKGIGTILNNDFPPPPTISFFTPSEGPVGTEVSINGANFIDVTEVAFNGLAVEDYVVESATLIRAVVPTGATTGKIRVTTATGTVQSANNFLVKASLSLVTYGSGSVALNPPGGIYNAGTVVTLTATADPGWAFIGWAGDLSSTANPETVAMNGDKSIIASFAQEGVGPVVHQETQTGAASDTDKVSLSVPIAGVSGQLYLAAISNRGNIPVTSVTGLGLSWSLVRAQCSGRDITGVEIWMALGTVAGGDIVTATFSGNPANAVMAVSRYSGIDMNDPIRVIISGNTNGEEGACADGTDSDFYTFDLPITLSRELVYSAAALRNRTHTPGPGYTEQAEISQGSGSQMAGLAVQDQEAFLPAMIPVAGSFGSDVDWAVAGLILRPGVRLIPNYTLTLNTAGSGSVNLDPAGGTYDSARVVTLTAMPDSGWSFDGWSGDLSGAANPDSIVMNSDKTVTATFSELPQYTLTLNQVGAGVVTLTPPGGVYYQGSAVILSAVPDSGYVFSGWSGDLSGSANPDTIIMNGNRTITATFTQLQQFTLEVDTVGLGAVILNPPGGLYYTGTVVTLAAVADSGYEFSGWSGDLNGSANPDSILMDTAKQVTATFTELPRYTLAANSSGAGSVTLDPPGGTYYAGTAVVLTAVPDSGYFFSGWSGDLSGADNPDTLVMNGNKSVTAAFADLSSQQFTLTASASGSGSVLLTPPGGIYSGGTTVTATAIPAPGFDFQGWNGDLSGSLNPDAVFMDSNKDITAEFVPRGEGSVTFEEVVTGAASNNTTVTTSAPLTGVSGDLYLAAITSRQNVAVSSVSGLGLTWTLVDAQCAARSVTRVEVWMAQGTPDPSGTVTATLSASVSNLLIAVSRYSGVDPLAPVGAIVSSNTLGIDGDCTGGNDTNGYAFNLTTTRDSSVVYAAIAPRNRTHTPGAGYIQRAFRQQGSGGEMAGVAVQDQKFGGPAPVLVNGSLSGVTDWAVIAVEIKPGETGGTPTYALNVNTSGAGNVILDPPGGYYNDGRVVTLTATPDSGYVFTGWSGDLIGSANPDSVVMDGDKTVTAIFSPRYALTVTVNGPGTVELDPPGGIYDSLAVVRLTAIPDSGYAFSGWSGDLSGATNPDSLLMDSDKSVTATFTRQFSLGVSVQGGGTVALDPSGGIYDSLEVVTLTATPDSGWVFAGWSGDLSGSANPDSLLMDGNKSVTATFTRQFSLTVNIEGGGSVALAPPGGIYDSLQVVRLIATPDSGWVFAGWSGDLSGSANPDSLVMDSDKSVTASFTRQFNLAVNIEGGGAVELDPSGGVYDSLEVVTLTATADSGWVFAGWSGDLSGVANPDSLLMDGNKSVTATFTRQFSLSVSVVGGGVVALDPPGGIYDSLEVVTLTATPDSGWVFAGWSGDLSGVANPDSLLMDANKSVTATFTRRFSLAVNIEGGGAVALDPSGGVYDSLQVVRLTATPDSGWVFAGWSGDLSGVANPDSLLMDANKSVTATFTRQFSLSVNVAGGGEVALAPSGGVYDSLQVVRLTATPDSGWVFAGWSGDLSGSANPDSLLMDANKSVTATFTRRFSLAVNIEGGGAVALDPSGGIYDSLEVVTLTATPDSGWVFAGWSGDLSGLANPDSLVMDANKSVTAIFTRQFSLAVNIEGGGAVALDPPGGVYDSLQVVRLTATPDSGWVFAGWSGDLSGSANPDSLVMDGNKSVTATFTRQFSLAVNIEGGGAVALDPSGGVYDSLQVVRLTATPDSGWVFAGWSGDLSGVANPDSLVMDSNKSVTATYTRQFSLSVSVEGGGAVGLDPPGGVYDSLEIVTLTATPDSGWVFAGWSGDLSGSANPDSLLMDANKSVTATFTRQFSLSVNVAGGGEVALAPSGGVYDSLQVVRLTATPDSGWVFAGWSGDLSGSANPDSLVMDGNKSVTATFTRQFSLSVNVAGGGEVALAPSGGVYDSLQVVRLTATPDSGWVFAGWSGDLSGSANPDSLLMDSDKSVTATFTRQFSLGVNVQGGGTVAFDPSGGIYDSLEVVTLTATPDSGWVFAGWSGDLSGVANPDSLVMDSNKSVTATYTRQFSLSVSVEGGGAVGLDPPGGVYDSLEIVTLTATPDSGWVFAGWSGDLSGSANPDSLLMDGDKSVTAIFTRQFSLSVSVEGGGAVALDPSGGIYDSLEVVTLTATPDSGWVFAGWSGDLNGLANPDSLLMDANKSVTATFTRRFSLSVSVEGGGEVAFDPSGGMYDSLEVVTLTATPDSGWVFAGWSGDLSGSANPDSLLMDGDKSVTATYTRQFSLGVSVEGGGAVALDPSGGIYDSLEVVTLTATADSGWVFAGWSGDLSGVANPDSLLMDANKSVTATFTHQFSLSVNVQGGGEVALDPSGGIYDSLEVVTLTATPDSGWVFAGWSGDLSGSANPDSLVMDANKSVTATFTRQFSLSVSVEGGGTVALDPSGGIYDSLEVVTLTATPDSGWVFAGWSGDLSGVANPDSLLMDGNKSVTATFTRQFSLSVSVEGGGEVAFDPLGGVYDSLEVVTLTATPDSGWVFAGWSGDLSGVANPDSLLMDGNKSVTATFTRQFSLSVSVVGGGVVALDPPGGIYDSLEVVTLTATPDSGWVFAGWSGDLSGVANPDSLLMDANKSVTATFTRRFSLAVNIEGGGAVALAPSGGVYDSLEVVTLTATPDSGWVFAGWSGDLSGLANPDSLLMDANKSVTATFTRQFSLGVNVQGGGIVALDPSGGVYDSLQVVRLTATPDSGWVFAGWSGDLSGSANPDSLLMDANKSVTATFEELPPLVVRAKIFLEGAYHGGSMNTILNDIGWLPLSQPYNHSPWNYAGGETVDSLPAAVVDWVLVGLRISPEMSDEAARAAFLASDGTLLDTNGVAGVAFEGVGYGDYYIVVYHRNHLAVMSAAAQSLSSASSEYDFTISLGRAYGTNPMKELGTGAYGMFCGDGNADGVVNEADKESVWRAENGTSWSYGKFGDFNLDGGIDVLDLNYCWRANVGATSGVPGITAAKGFPGRPAPVEKSSKMMQKSSGEKN